MTADPLAFQILWDRLLAMVEEQARVLVRTAFCSTVREAEDLSFGLFDRQGRMVTQAATGTPGHVNAMAATVVHFLDRFPLATMRPGDHFMTNDPWLASGHRHDLTLVSPVFHDGRPVALVASTCHQVDIGGRGQTADGTSVYEEGLALPIMRICSGGRLHEDVRLIVRENVRHPDEVEGDILSMVTAGETAATGLSRLLAEFGLADIDALAEGILSRTEAATRAAIRRCPEGSWRSALALDGFGAPIRLACRLTIAGGEIACDFAGSSPAQPRGVNLVLNYTAAYAAFGVKCVVSPDLPNNAGALAPIRITAPVGSVLNVERPWPVAARHIIGQFLPELVMNCLAQALPGRVPADGASCVWTVQLRGGGAGPHDPPFDAVFFNAGGTGARSGRDGLDATAFPSGIRATASEVVEAIAPVVIWRKELASGSGGDGARRGGLGQVVEVGSRSGEAFTVFALYDRIRHAARGRDGGHDGLPGAAWLGSGAPLEGLGAQPVPAGDRLCLRLPGGGGFGDPRDRGVEAVLRDVGDGRIDANRARAVYGVVVDDAGRPDAAATAAPRTEVGGSRDPAPDEKRKRPVKTTDVVIAGAGPVGQFAALLLARRGYEVALIEAETEPVVDHRASTFHAPTLDMLDVVGVGEALVARGRIAREWEVRLHPVGERAVFDISLIAGETAHPYRLQCEQWELQDLFRTHLDGHCTQRLGETVTGFDQDDTGVTVHTEGPDGAGAIRARFLIGCDGSRSSVRKAMGLGFEGQTYPETTFLTTTTFPFQDHIEGLTNVAYCWWQDGGNFSLLRMRDVWRVSIYARDDVPLDAQMTPEAVQATLHRILDKDGPFALGMEPRPYKVHMRIADSYVTGRVALAGDAAHLNSPVGGMGLNGGLHDAQELVEALDAALKGGDHAALLARYDRRRRPAARDEIMLQADRARARMREPDAARRRALLAELQALAGDPVRARAHLLESSMITSLRNAARIP